MKKFLPVLVAFVVLAALAAPVLAQDTNPLPDTLPDTAAQGVEVIAVFLAGLAGLLASALTDGIKRLPWLSDGDKSKIAGPAAELVVVLVSVASAALIGYLAQLAGLLDTSGIWQVVLFAWPAARGWYEVAERRRAAIKIAPVAK